MASVFGGKRRKRSSQDRRSAYSVVSCSDLTPGSLEVWLDLPDGIKYDPALAPFRRQYEHHHGKLDTAAVISNDEKQPELPATGETVVENHRILCKVSGTRLMSDDKDNVNIKSAKKKKLEQTLRIVKLSALVFCWVLLTVSLLLNQEKTDVVLYTAVQWGAVKEYHLAPSDARVTLLAKLSGPFAQAPRNASIDSDTLYLWLSRNHWNGTDVVEQNSTFWTIQLQPPEQIDFSKSVSESKTLLLEDAEFFSAGSPERNASGAFTKNGENASSVTLRMYTNSESIVPLTVVYQLNPLSEEDGIIYATILLCVLYVLIIFEIVNRTVAALLLSTLGVATLAFCDIRPSLPELVSWLDVETLLLLFSMMLLVAILADTGLFDYLAVLAFEAAGGRTWPLINCLCLFTAVSSTFLDNVTTVLLMTPVTIRLCEVMQLNPVPVLMSMVIFSNVGGAATPVGDPPNVIIASHPAILLENINFTTFTLHMGVGILLVGVQTYAQIRFMFRDMNKLRHSVPFDVQELRQEIQAWRRAASSLSSYSRDENIVRKALEKKDR